MSLLLLFICCYTILAWLLLLPLVTKSTVKLMGSKLKKKKKLFRKDPCNTDFTIGSKIWSIQGQRCFIMLHTIEYLVGTTAQIPYSLSFLLECKLRSSGRQREITDSNLPQNKRFGACSLLSSLFSVALWREFVPIMVSR